MDALTQLVSQASDFLWNVVLIIILCGTESTTPFV